MNYVNKRTKNLRLGTPYKVTLWDFIIGLHDNNACEINRILPGQTTEVNYA